MSACAQTFVPAQEIHYSTALRQHDEYCRLLGECGAKVVRLDGNRDMPDCTFIEDTAVVLDELAIVCALGVESRRAEPAGIEPELRKYCDVIRIEPPATLEGGDVLRIGRTLLVGHSIRTNPLGIAAFRSVVEPLGYRVVPVAVRGCLHLKTACTGLPDQSLLVNPLWIDPAPLKPFRVLPIPNDELWAANVALIGRIVIMPASCPRTADLLKARGMDVRPVDISEFQKAEGGVTCLSILIDRSL